MRADFLWQQLIGRLSAFYLRRRLGVPDLKVVGRPMIIQDRGAKITIGPSVTLNSNPITYHALMHSPLKLWAHGKGASVSIGANTRLNGCCIHARSSISIGKGCLIAANVSILDSNGHNVLLDKPEERINSVDEPKPIIIGDNVWIGLNAIILPGTQIGSGSVVSANAVVKGNFPVGSIIGPSPSSRLN